MKSGLKMLLTCTAPALMITSACSVGDGSSPATQSATQPATQPDPKVAHTNGAPLVMPDNSTVEYRGLRQ